jgi:hypothetical protein
VPTRPPRHPSHRRSAVTGFGAGAIYLDQPYFAATTATRGENDVKDVRYKGFQSAGGQIMMLVG